MSTINSNLPALTAALSLDRSQDLLSQSMNRLSSGSKIASPGDDPAGLAVAGKLGAQNQRLGAASTNVQNALSYTQTADSFLGSMGGVLTRLSELATMAQDPTKNPSDVALYAQEFQSLQDQLRSTIGGATAQIGGTTAVTAPEGSFNGTTLFGSTAGGGVTLDIGDSAGQQMTIPDINLQSGAMLSMIQQDSSGAYTLQATDSGATAAITAALQQVGADRATLGASQSRLNLAASTIQVEQQNLSSAVSGISDVDVAQESTQLARYNILVQSGAAMLVQANQAPQSVLKLLQNG
jgi:flagellin